MRRVISTFPLILAMAVAGLFSFKSVAFAADQAVPNDASALDLLKPVWQAFAHGDYLYAGCLAIVLAVALLRRYGTNWKWMHTDAGSALLVLSGSLGASLAAHLADGGHLTMGMVWSALKIAFGAAGGYTVVKHLLVEPVVKPLQKMLPPWAQPIFGVVLWVFDRKAVAGSDALADADKAGQVAVEANPSKGVEDVIGKPTEVQ